MKMQWQVGRGGVCSVRLDAPLALARGAGELRVRDGAVWLTRRDDLEDHRLQAGDCVRLAAGDAAVVESWQRDQPAQLDWQPASGVLSAASRLLRATAARGLGALAGGAQALAAALQRAARQLD